MRIFYIHMIFVLCYCTTVVLEYILLKGTVNQTRVH